MVKGFDKISESVDQVMDFKRVLGMGVRVLAKDGNARVGSKGVIGSKLFGSGWFGWSNDYLELLLKKNNENKSKCRFGAGKDGIRVLAECRVLSEGKLDSRVSAEYNYENKIRGKAEYKIEEQEYSTEITAKWEEFNIGGRIQIKEGVSFIGGIFGWLSNLNEAILKYEAAGFELGNVSAIIKSKVRQDLVIGSKVVTDLKNSRSEVKIGLSYDLDSGHRFRAVVGHEGGVFLELRKRLSQNLVGKIFGGLNLNDLVLNKGQKEGVGLRFEYENNK